MNPAALKSDLSRLAAGGTLIVNEDAFEERNLEKAGYVDNPLEDGSLDGYALTTLRASLPVGERFELYGRV